MVRILQVYFPAKTPIMHYMASRYFVCLCGCGLTWSERHIYNKLFVDLSEISQDVIDILKLILFFGD
jgi:hypothetical protein